MPRQVPENNFAKRPNDIWRGGSKKQIYTILKEGGYTPSDITLAFQTLAFYTEAKIQKVINDKRQPMITRIIATQFEQALTKKDWNKIKDLIEHIVGRPTQSVNQTVEVKEQPLLGKSYNKTKISQN